MDIVYAAEKPSIADVLSDRLCDHVRPQEIEVCENPDETGKFPRHVAAESLCRVAERQCRTCFFLLNAGWRISRRLGE